MYKFNGTAEDGRKFSGTVDAETFPAAMESVAKAMKAKMPDQVAGCRKLTVQEVVAADSFKLVAPRAPRKGTGGAK